MLSTIAFAKTLLVESYALWTGVDSTSFRAPSNHEFEIPLFIISVKTFSENGTIFLENFWGNATSHRCFLAIKCADFIFDISYTDCMKGKITTISFTNLIIE